MCLGGECGGGWKACGQGLGRPIGGRCDWVGRLACANAVCPAKGREAPPREAHRASRGLLDESGAAWVLQRARTQGSSWVTRGEACDRWSTERRRPGPVASFREPSGGGGGGGSRVCHEAEAPRAPSSQGREGKRPPRRLGTQREHTCRPRCLKRAYRQLCQLAQKNHQGRSQRANLSSRSAPRRGACIAPPSWAPAVEMATQADNPPARLVPVSRTKDPPSRSAQKNNCSRGPLVALVFCGWGNARSR